MAVENIFNSVTKIIIINTCTIIVLIIVIGGDKMEEYKLRSKDCYG